MYRCAGGDEEQEFGLGGIEGGEVGGEPHAAADETGDEGTDRTADGGDARFFTPAVEQQQGHRRGKDDHDGGGRDGTHPPYNQGHHDEKDANQGKGQSGDGFESLLPAEDEHHGQENGPQQIEVIFPAVVHDAGGDKAVVGREDQLGAYLDRPVVHPLDEVDGRRAPALKLP